MSDDLKTFVERGQAAQAAVDQLTRPKLSIELLRAEARAKADRACALIERAQNDLASACAELSALTGGVSVWKATSRMHDSVRGLWWRVHAFRNGRRYRLDAVNVAALEEGERQKAAIAALEASAHCGDAAEWDSPGVRR